MRKHKKIKKRSSRRHKWGSFESHRDVRDGTYQICERCGATRFFGDRYAYGRVPCR